jgi:hypothetical protein
MAGRAQGARHLPQGRARGSLARRRAVGGWLFQDTVGEHHLLLRHRRCQVRAVRDPLRTQTHCARPSVPRGGPSPRPDRPAGLRPADCTAMRRRSRPVPRLPAARAHVGVRQTLERRGHALHLGQARPHVPQPRRARVLPQSRSLAPVLNRRARPGKLVGCCRSIGVAALRAELRADCVRRPIHSRGFEPGLCSGMRWS